jgi:hypothetical protein
MFDAKRKIHSVHILFVFFLHLTVHRPSNNIISDKWNVNFHMIHTSSPKLPDLSRWVAVCCTQQNTVRFIVLYKSEGKILCFQRISSFLHAILERPTCFRMKHVIENLLLFCALSIALQNSSNTAFRKMDLCSSSKMFPIGRSPFTTEKRFTFKIDCFKNSNT